MSDLNDEWALFLKNNGNTEMELVKDDTIKQEFLPEFSDLYISTQTKIGYLNNQIDLNDVFWKIPILPYERPEEGVIKKIMKINSIDEHAVEELEKYIERESNITVDIISQVNNISGDKENF